jgi:hypothetical protein
MTRERAKLMDRESFEHRARRQRRQTVSAAHGFSETLRDICGMSSRGHFRVPTAKKGELPIPSA